MQTCDFTVYAYGDNNEIVNTAYCGLPATHGGAHSEWHGNAN